MRIPSTPIRTPNVDHTPGHLAPHVDERNAREEALAYRVACSDKQDGVVWLSGYKAGETFTVKIHSKDANVAEFFAEGNMYRVRIERCL